MSSIASTPIPPYYAVIFTSLRTDGDNGYAEMATRMVQLAAEQPGFIGIESAREEVGITVSYWRDLESIKQWKANTEHLVAQKLGREQWYTSFKPGLPKLSETMVFNKASQQRPLRGPDINPQCGFAHKL